MFNRHTKFEKVRIARHQILVFFERPAARCIIYRAPLACWAKFYCANLFHAIKLFLPSCVTHTMTEN
jgi:hypothetical protein